MTKDIYAGTIYNEKTLLKNVIQIECQLKRCTQSHLFELLGYPPSYAGSYLKRPPREFLTRVADVFNINPEILYRAPIE